MRKSSIWLCMGFLILMASSLPATVVYEVDEKTIRETKHWSHSAPEAGDYQIGMAWVDVDDGGDGVALNISVEGKTIRSLDAKPGSRVTRFETRLEA